MLECVYFCPDTGQKDGVCRDRAGPEPDLVLKNRPEFQQLCNVVTFPSDLLTARLPVPSDLDTLPPYYAHARPFLFSSLLSAVLNFLSFF